MKNHTKLWEEGKIKKKRIFWLVIIIAIIVALIVSSKEEEPDLSMLNINNVLSYIGSSGEGVAEMKDSRTISFLAHADFLKLFKEKEWQEKKISLSPETIPTLIIHLNDEYRLYMYSPENIAIVQFESDLTGRGNLKEMSRSYEVPDGVCEAVLGYVLWEG